MEWNAKRCDGWNYLVLRRTNLISIDFKLMTITSIKQQIRNPERASIFVDGKYSFSLSLDEIVKTKVKNGQELDRAALRRYQKISSDGKIRSTSLGWVLNRPRSTREFSDYLKRKKVDSALAGKLITEFSQKKYLSDENYTSWLIELRRRQGKSNRAIASELSMRGISREQYSKILQQDGDETERLKLIIDKKIGLSRYKNDQNKLIKYLIAKGFSYNDIKKELSSRRH